MNPAYSQMYTRTVFLKSVIILRYYRGRTTASSRLFIRPLIIRFFFLALSPFRLFTARVTLELTHSFAPHTPGIFVTLPSLIYFPPGGGTARLREIPIQIPIRVPFLLFGGAAAEHIFSFPFSCFSFSLFPPPSPFSPRPFSFRARRKGTRTRIYGTATAAVFIITLIFVSILRYRSWISIAIVPWKRYALDRLSNSRPLRG